MAQDTPKNLPVEGKSLLDNVDKGEEKPVASSETPPETPPETPTETKPEPQKPPTAEGAEVEDIFGNVKEVPATQKQASETSKPKDDTLVETPHQGFKKVLITIGSIVLLVGILAGGGYWAYTQFLKPKPLSPNLNLLNTNTAPTNTATTPTSKQPATVTPTQPLDSDNDGLSDSEEATLGTNPLNPDSDGDKLFDREEVSVYKTDPLIKDTDGDGYEDGAEVRGGYDPKGPGKLIKIPVSQ